MKGNVKPFPFNKQSNEKYLIAYEIIRTNKTTPTHF